MSEISKIIPPPDLLAKGLDAARKRAEFFSSKSAEIVTNSDIDAIDKQGASANGGRRRKQEKRAEAKVQELIESIPDGASFVLRSPKGGMQTPYFREGDNFYLESEREGTSKSIQTSKIKDRLRTWTLESITSPVADPVAPAVPDAPDLVLPIPSSPSQTSNPGIQNANEHNLLRLQQLEEEERDGLTPPDISPDPVTPAIPVNATELQEEKTLPTEAEIEAGQKELESYVSGEVFAEQILAEQDNRGKENIMAPGSAEADEVLKKFGKNAEEVLNQGISHLEKQIKELYITTTDRDGKRVESGKLVELRKQYAEAEYRNVGVWQRLREKLGVRKKESDSVPEREVYYQALQQLISLKIDELKLQKNIPPEELKKKMVETLQFFGTESKIKLYEAWTQATMKREGVYAKAVGLCEDFGNQYNKLKLWQKVGLGAIAVGTSLATGGGAMATGMLVARRAAAGLGSFAMFEGVFEKMSQKRASNVIQNRAGELMTEMKEEDAEKRLEQLMKTLKSEMSEANLRQELHDRAKGKTVRTLSAAALSLGMMFGIPHVADRIKDAYFGAGVAENATDVAKKGADAATKAVTENVSQTPAPGGGMVAAEQLKNALDGGADSQAGVVPAASGVVAEAMKTGVEAPIPADYEIVKGDTTWRLLDGYLTDHDKAFTGMTEGQQTHAIDALKDKLKLLTPAQLKEAGFSSGNIDKLRIGDTVHLDKLLGAVDADKAIANAGNISVAAQHSIEQNNEAIAKWVVAHPGVPINDAVIENQILHPHAGVASDVAHGSRVQLPPQGFTGVPADYHASSVDDSTTGQLKEEVSKLKQEVAVARELANATAMQPRVEGWIKPMLESVPEGSPVSSISMAEMKKIPLRDIQYAMTHDSADAYERVHMTRDQFANVKQFIQGAEKDRLVPPLNDIVGRRPDLKIGDYITKIALDPKVKIGYMVGGRGGFSTSI